MDSSHHSNRLHYVQSRRASAPLWLALVGLVLLTSLRACSSDEVKPGTGMVEGYVYLRGSLDHSGTEVRVAQRSAMTDSTGHYYFDGMPDGTWTLRALHPGYWEEKVEVRVSAGFVVEPPPEMRLYPSLWSYVYLEGQEDHSGICVWIGGSEPVFGTAESGAYLLPLMLDGSYILGFSFPGYETIERPLEIVDGLPYPALQETTLAGPFEPLIVQLSDGSRPETNPTQTPATVAVSVFTQDGMEIRRQDFVVDGNWGGNGCYGNYFVISGLDVGVQYDVVLAVPRYFALGFFNESLATPPDTLRIEDVALQQGLGVRTRFASLASYFPDQIIVVLSPDLSETEREAIISSEGCSVIERLGPWDDGAPMYLIDIPDERTELEMLRVFNALQETVAAFLSVPGPFNAE